MNGENACFTKFTLYIYFYINFLMDDWPVDRAYLKMRTDPSMAAV